MPGRSGAGEADTAPGFVGDQSRVGQGLDHGGDRARVHIERGRDLAHGHQRLGLALFLEGNVRSNARVDEDIVAKPAAIGEATEEFDVMGGNGVADKLERILSGQAVQARRINAVTLQALGAPE